MSPRFALALLFTWAACFGVNAAPATAGTLAAGDADACAIRNDGAVECWGRTYGDTPVAIDGLTNALDISYRIDEGCAALRTGAVRCWNDDWVNAPITVNDAIAVGGGQFRGCALRAAGTAVCWGMQQPPPGITRIVSLSVGRDAACAVQFDGTMGCWGSGLAVTRQPTGITDAAQVVVASLHACLLRKTGTVTCWGPSEYAPMGTDGEANISGITDAVQVTANLSHSCAQLQSGAVKCWGYGADGALGNGSQGTHSAPVTAAGATATTLTAGYGFTCIRRTTGALGCWGSNKRGQHGTAVDFPSAPVTVAGLTGATALGFGGSHRCAVVAAGAVKCWGDNFMGRLGDGTSLTQPAPVSLPGLTGFSALGGGSTHHCGLKGQAVWCWGSGDATQSETPSVIAGVSAKAISSSYNHSCAITTTNEVSCWGRRGGSTATATPTVVADTANTAQIISGYDWDCLRTTAGKVRCWGANGSGQLGDGTQATRPTVADTVGVTNATDIRANGESAACAKLADLTVKCWGSGSGTTPTTNGATWPTEPCAIAVGPGTVSCLGDSTTGELGDGYMPAGHYPVALTLSPMSGLPDVRAWNGPFRLRASDITILPTSLRFPLTAVGAISDPLTVTLKNTTDGFVPTYLETTDPTGQFTLSTTTCSESLEPGGACTISYLFKPTTEGEQSGTATVSVAGAPTPIALSGSGPSGFVVTPAAAAFSATKVGAESTQPITILNVGGKTRTLNFVATGLAPDFGIESQCGETLAPGASCLATARFRPTTAGTRTASASLSLAGTAHPITLTGEGIVDPPAVSPPPVVLPPPGFSFTSAVSKNQRLTVLFFVPGAGKATVGATTSTKVKGKKKPKRSTYAKSKTVTVKAGTVSVGLSPTSKAKTALKQRKTTKVEVAVTFKPAGGKPVTLTKTVSVKGPKR